MPGRKIIDPAAIENISNDIFALMPLVRKQQLLHMAHLQNAIGVPLSYMQVLILLGQMGTMSMSVISYRLGIAKPNLTALIDRLIEDHLVDRIRDTVDRRAVNIVLLDAGREILASIQAAIGEQAQEWAERISHKELQEMADSLATLNRFFHRCQGTVIDLGVLKTALARDRNKVTPALRRYLTTLMLVDSGHHAAHWQESHTGLGTWKEATHSLTPGQSFYSALMSVVRASKSISPLTAHPRMKSTKAFSSIASTSYRLIRVSMSPSASPRMNPAIASASASSPP